MNEISPEFGTDFEQTGDPNSPGLDFTSDLQKDTRYLEFHQITRGCLYSNFEYFGDIQVGCWDDDLETEDIELQIPPEYRVENGKLFHICRIVLAR